MSNKFIKRSREKFGDKYGYDLSTYKNLKSRIFIICPYHGNIPMIANSHLRSRTGCTKCSRNRRRIKKVEIDQKKLIRRIKKLYYNLYKFDKTKVNKSNYVWIECNKHGKVNCNVRKLLNGRGCPKCKISKSEIQIMVYLEKRKIKYEHQKKFKECKNIKELPFDFYIPEKNILIEYDGKQHYEPIRKFGGKKGYLEQRMRDNIKNNFCKKVNIELKRIRYDEDLIDRMNKIFNKS